MMEIREKKMNYDDVSLEREKKIPIPTFADICG